MPRTSYENQLITDDSFNEVVEKYVEFWTDPKDGGTVVTYTYDPAAHILPDGDADTATTTRRQRGWGQPDPTSILTVSPGIVILADHFNKFVSHVNSGEFHRIHDDTNAGVIATRINHVADSNQLIRHSDLEPVETLMTNIKGVADASDKKRFALETSADVTPTTIYTHNTAWGSGDLSTDLTRQSLSTVIKYTWPDYTSARHFFNSGCQLGLEFDTNALSTPTGADDDWDTMFTSIGTVYIGGVTNHTGSTGTVVNNRGFYSLTQSYQQVFTATESAGYTSAYTYNAYGGRETMIEAKVDMDGTDFCVWLKVTFIEDVDDTAQHTNEFNIEASERYAINAPDATIDAAYIASSNGDLHKGADTTLYEFDTRQALIPTKVQEGGWVTATETLTIVGPRNDTVTPTPLAAGDVLTIQLSDAGTVTGLDIFGEIVNVTGTPASQFTPAAGGYVIAASYRSSGTTMQLTLPGTLTSGDQFAVRFYYGTSTSPGTQLVQTPTITVS